jgi:UDP-2,4-diacetamido-2,4,6-trideoxy-beta-L-altropyranose hydrolase
MSGLTFTFRADASAEIGIGHVMRCLALANHLLKEKHSTLFICRSIPETLKCQIRKAGHDLIILKPSQLTINSDDYSTWLRASQQQDAQETINILDKINNHWLIVDHYGIDHKWEKYLRAYTDHLMVIDDLANRKHDCDILLDQTFKRETKDYNALLNSDTFLLLGSKFSLLRDEFHNDTEKVLELRNKNLPSKSDVLVMLGGTDPSNLTSRCIKTLKRNQNIEKIIVILSNNAVHLSKITNEYQSDRQLTIHISPKNISQIMLDVDVAIGASGTSSWERCATGLPSVSIVQAENQRLIAKNLQENGIATTIEQDEIEVKLNKHVNNWLSNSEKYKNAVDSGLAICDGKGVKRVFKALTLLRQVKLRIATEDDSDIYFQWANHTSIRQYAFSKDSISYDKHQQWFINKLNNKNSYLFVGLIKERPIGQVRFDREKKGNSYLIDIHLNPEEAGKGYGTFLLFNALLKLKNTVNHPIIVNAVVFENNISSKKMFDNNHFKLTETKHINGQCCHCYQWAAQA